MTTIFSLPVRYTCDLNSDVVLMVRRLRNIGLSKNVANIVDYRITNNNVLPKTHKSLALLKTVQGEKLQNFGYFMWSVKYCLLQLILQGRRGRRKITWLNFIKKVVQHDYHDTVIRSKFTN